MMVLQTTEVSIDGMRAAGQFSIKEEFHFFVAIPIIASSQERC